MLGFGVCALGSVLEELASGWAGPYRPLWGPPLPPQTPSFGRGHGCSRAVFALDGLRVPLATWLPPGSCVGRCGAIMALQSCFQLHSLTGLYMHANTNMQTYAHTNMNTPNPSFLSTVAKVFSFSVFSLCFFWIIVRTLFLYCHCLHPPTPLSGPVT